MSLFANELAKVQEAMGGTSSIMASAVARLYLSSPDPKQKSKKKEDSVLLSFPDVRSDQWLYTQVMGALVLSIDRSQQGSFFFQIYDLETYEMRYEYELYEDIAFNRLDPQFMAFEMEDCVAGFSFADKAGATKFYSKVRALRPTSTDDAVSGLRKGNKGFGGFGGSKKRKAAKKKGAIKVGNVMNVVHNAHVGLNSDGSFDLNNISPEWKQLFRQAGIKKKDLANPEVANAIIQTIAETAAAEAYEEVPIEDVPPAPAESSERDELAKVYTAQQLAEYDAYQEEMRQYEADMAAYEAEQAALAAWERDNVDMLTEQKYYEAEDVPPPPAQDATDAELVGERGSAPALPARKTRGRGASLFNRQKKEDQKKADEAEARERARLEANQREAYEREQALEEQRRVLEEEETERRLVRQREMANELAEAEAAYAAQMARLAEQEQEDLQRQIEDMRERTRQAEEERVRRAEEKRIAEEEAKKKRAPPLPKRLPDRPPLPAQPPAPPKPPTPPKLPPLPKASKKAGGKKKGGFSLMGIGQVKLKKAETVDKSAPDVTGKRGRGKQEAQLLGGIELGLAKLKPAAERPQAALPKLEKMEEKEQNNLMTALVNTMTNRRGALAQDFDDDDESDDGWSD